MKRQVSLICILSVLSVFIIACAGVETESLPQLVEHRDYEVRFPQSWNITKETNENPTIYYEVDGKEAGGLFLARYDKLDELPASRKELSDLSTSAYRVFQYDSIYETEQGKRKALVVCFYVPAKNSGYEFVFVRDWVSDTRALEIANTVLIK